MTNKEFFVHTIKDEQPRFLKVLQALPQDQLGFKPHEKSRSMGQLAFQLASQWFFISAIVKQGKPDWSQYKEPANFNVDEMVAALESNFAQLISDLATTTDQDWENNTAKMEWPGGKWEVKKYEMAWSFLFDAIHHRGQMTTYLRAAGAKVPSVYGGSADEKPAGM